MLSYAAGVARPTARTILRRAAVALIAFGCTTIMVLVSVTNAFPSVPIVRAAQVSRATIMFEAEARYVPRGVSSATDLAYDAQSSDPRNRHETLNAFWPTGTPSGARLPTVVWIHGGAWIGGRASWLNNHLQIVAKRGYTTVTVGYTLAPDARYPTPLRQVMAALGYLNTNADRLHVDPARIVLAGDSAGAQLAAQTAAMIEDPAYAAQVGVTPTLAPGTLRGVLLYCGVYDWTLRGVRGPFRSLLLRALLLYTGTSHPATVPRLATGSVLHFVPRGFPPTFITAGNADPLLSQSLAMRTALQDRGVPVDSLFFPADYRPGLPHEYEFQLQRPAARTALTRTFAFLARYTG